jgi:hypothetical protein
MHASAEIIIVSLTSDQFTWNLLVMFIKTCNTSEECDPFVG